TTGPKPGAAMPARTARMATTTNNSTAVKPAATPRMAPARAWVSERSRVVCSMGPDATDGETHNKTLRADRAHIADERRNPPCQQEIRKIVSKPLTKRSPQKRQRSKAKRSEHASRSDQIRRDPT